MTDERQLPYWRAQLIISLEGLGALGAELRGSDGQFPADALAEADELLARARRAMDQLAPAHPPLDADALRATRTRGGLDALTVAYTVGITTLVLPFVQTLAQRAGEDAYRTLMKLIGGRGREPRPDRIVLGDRETEVHVTVDTRVDGTALAALQHVDFTDEALREATLRWNPDRGAWEAEPGRPQVSLWLPGDPLDEDWDQDGAGPSR
ncbi:hypothetical protein DF268_07200 [Streptomyces sp. V2]|uniref:hypothetical protein n=1 Tax=Streptomyces sp. V2 TaxID=1424099 RepID=UPI000D66CFB0|nr:hypothetical protein [Streptomyces sp. V2]PWG14327.1 hypothetical protein DF268_07200 [Streptomyces sp. V2]